MVNKAATTFYKVKCTYCKKADYLLTDVDQAVQPREYTDTPTRLRHSRNIAAYNCLSMAEMKLEEVDLVDFELHRSDIVFKKPKVELLPKIIHTSRVDNQSRVSN